LSIRILLFTVAVGTGWAQCPYSCPFEIQCQGLCDTQFGDPADPCLYAATGGCRQGQDRRGNCCCDPTPILIDVDGSGLRLSSAAQGVPFLINGPIAVMTPWPMLGSTNGWLALDRNGNGLIDGGSELFGGLTSQPEPPAGQVRNGFLALAEFDRPANGGNGDGRISGADAIWPRLRIWQDRNRNGVSESGELVPLQGFGITALALDFRDSRRVDRNGNQFRYRGRIFKRTDSLADDWAWDVILRLSSGTRPAAPTD
jgi:hypothetical protein